MYKVTNVEETPNPDALKFVVDQTVVETGSKQFESAAAAASDPLAKSIFEVPGVQSVFYLGTFITVSKEGSANWNKIGPRVIQLIQATNGVTEKPATNGTAAKNGAAASADGELMDRINAVIDENVRPALAGDGGGLEVISLEGYTLTIRYQGACGSCPSSTAGTMAAVQNLLQRMVDPKLKVVSEQGMMGHY